jgi:hypothetical protein
MSFDNAKYRAEYKRKIRKERQATGMCQTCGKMKEDFTKSCCEFCLKRAREYTKTQTGKEKHKAGRQRRAKTAYGMWRRLKDSAGGRGLEFNISIDDILIPVVCPLLGITLEFNGSRYNTPSLDRIDNTKGYIKGNVWVISDLANRMKQNASIEDLRTFAKNVLIHFPD